MAAGSRTHAALAAQTRIRRWGGRASARMLVLALLALPLAGAAFPADASAISAPIHIAGTAGQGVAIRPAPDTAQPALGRIPDGASPDYQCFTYGQMIGNVNVWFSVQYRGVAGFYASYYDDSSYHSEAELTSKYGIPKCGTGATPTSVTSAVPAPQGGTQAPLPAALTGALVSQVYNAPGGVYYRHSPRWPDTSRTPGVGVYDGDQVQLLCGAIGDPVGPSNNAAWSYVQDLTRPSIGRGWVSEHFINDGAPVNGFVAGEPACGTTLPQGAQTPGSSGPSSSDPGPSNPSGCPTYGVVDSRGSGESYGMSPLGKDVVGELSARAVGRVGSYWNPYPAVGLTDNLGQWLNAIGSFLGIGPLGAYHDSVVDGKQWLSAFVPRELQQCPNIRLILVGYSQGAQVTGDVYQTELTNDERRHIADVLLFGDPYFKPHDPSDRGSFSDRSGALGSRSSFHGPSRVLSYCHHHDPVCQAQGDGLAFVLWGFSEHENYQTDAQSAARVL